VGEKRTTARDVDGNIAVATDPAEDIDRTVV
jgi:hypothetical protein